MLERIVQAGSVSLATRAWLCRTGPCVVLVHGLGTNLESWGSLVPLLRGWCTVIAFDRRSHGHSSDAASYTATELAGDIAAVVDTYDLAEPILIGHSIGAWDCLTYAARHPARAVICLDQAIASDDPVWRGSLSGAESSSAAERGYTDLDWTELMTRAEAELGAQAWRELYGPMNRRATVRRSDGLRYIRPDPRVLRDIQSSWASFIGNGEPYDDIACRTVVALAQRNPGPIHDALKRLVSRRNLESIDADSDHDIHVRQPQLIADSVRSICTDSVDPYRGDI